MGGTNPGFSVTPLAAVQINARLLKCICWNKKKDCKTAANAGFGRLCFNSLSPTSTLFLGPTSAGGSPPIAIVSARSASFDDIEACAIGRTLFSTEKPIVQTIALSP
jgi:hypothetical protein